MAHLPVRHCESEVQKSPKPPFGTVVVVVVTGGATEVHALELVTQSSPRLVPSSDWVVELGIPALRHFLWVADQPQSKYVVQPVHDVARDAHSVFLAATELESVVVVVLGTAMHCPVAASHPLAHAPRSTEPQVIVL